MLVEIFQRFDTYGDGTISLTRLTRALEKLNLDHQSIDLAIASADGSSSDRINYVKFASWVTGYHEPSGKPEDATLVQPGSLRAAAEAGEAVLLRGSWLAKLAREGKAPPEREELPPEALWDPKELFELGDRMLRHLRKGGHAEFLPIVSVSFRRPSEGQAMPDAEQLQILALALEHLGTYLAQAFKEFGCPADCGVFLEGCSLRRPAGAAAEKNIEKLGLWYGHSLIRKLLIRGQQTPEDDGVAFLESSLSGLISQHQMVLRIGNFDHVRSCKDWPSLRKVCGAGRPPPLTPEAASALLDAKRFATTAQQDAAKQCYRLMFDAAVTSCRRLVFPRLGWGDDEIRTLATALPRCPRLMELFLEGNRVGDAGAGILAGVLPHCPALKEVLLAGNRIGDTGVEQLAKALPQVPRLERLELQENLLGEAAAKSLAMTLPAAKCLRHLLLQGNRLGDAGVKALAAALPSCAGLQCLVLDTTGAGDAAAAALCEAFANSPSLQLLHLESNALSEASREALRKAWQAAGKPERSELNGKSYPALML